MYKKSVMHLQSRFFLLIKPIVFFFTFLSPSASLDLKVPIIWDRHQEQLRPRFIPSTLDSDLVREPQLPEQTSNFRKGLLQHQFFHSLKRLCPHLTLQPWITWMMLLLHHRIHLREIQSFKHQRLSN